MPLSEVASEGFKTDKGRLPRRFKNRLAMTENLCPWAQQRQPLQGRQGTGINPSILFTPTLSTFEMIVKQGKGDLLQRLHSHLYRLRQGGDFIGHLLRLFFVAIPNQGICQ